MLNALTIDVEDYFQVSAFEHVSPPDTWDARQSRVEGNTDRLLQILADRGVRATFFILGWVAERFPGLVRRVSDGGHEVASHGYGHRRVYHQTRAEFREDVRKSKIVLEDLSGSEVIGYRAPSYSISPETLWAFDELFEAGYRYDSSVFPVRHDLYGMPGWPRFPFVVERLADGNWVPVEPQADEPGTRNPEQLLEIPIATVELAGRNLPIGGGGYFRLLPYAVTRWGLRRLNFQDLQPFVFYLHPWEIDAGQPRIRGAGLKSRFRHYLNLAKTEDRLQRLLGDFRFGTIRELLGDALPEQILPQYVTANGAAAPDKGIRC